MLLTADPITLKLVLKQIKLQIKMKDWDKRAGPEERGHTSRTNFKETPLDSLCEFSGAYLMGMRGV